MNRLIKEFKRELPIWIAAGILTLALLIKLSNFAVVEQLQLKVFDLFQINKPREYTPQPVKIIDIDNESLERLGQWPWPRSVLANLVTQLTHYGAAAIAFDVVFAEPDRTSPDQIYNIWDDITSLPEPLKHLPNHDHLFAEAIAQSNVVTGFVLTQDDKGKIPTPKFGFAVAGNDPKEFMLTYKYAVTSLPELEKAATGNGGLNSNVDLDGTLRKIPLSYVMQDKFYPSLFAEALRIAQGARSYVIKTSGASGEEDFGQNTGISSIKIGEFEIPTDSQGNLWVYYTHYTDERYIPAWKIFEPDFNPESIAGHILFLGTSAAGLKDIRATPLNRAANGVEVHVQALEQVLSGEYISRPEWMHGAEILLMVFMGIVLIYVMTKASALWGAFFTSVILVSAALTSWYMFTEKGILIDPVTPSIAIVMIYLSESLSRYISTEHERQRVRDAFMHFMSPALVEELAANPEKLKLGGEIKDLTILFCDIRGFTTISEGFDAQGLTQFINEFLTPMSGIILDNRGTIDKYIGDCIMAFWNAPLDDEKHAYHGCISALKMTQHLTTLNEEQKKKAEEDGRKFVEIKIGIGLNTGEICVGNMGSEQRFDYSVLGDDVNLASRLEGQTKTYGVPIIIGETTQQSVPELATMELDIIRVKGKQKPVRIFGVFGDTDLKNDPRFQKTTMGFLQMLGAYRSQQWDLAMQYAELCYDEAEGIDGFDIDYLLTLYGSRIEAYMANPPSRKWDGVFIAMTK